MAASFDELAGIHNFIPTATANPAATAIASVMIDNLKVSIKTLGADHSLNCASWGKDEEDLVEEFENLILRAQIPAEGSAELKELCAHVCEVVHVIFGFQNQRTEQGIDNYTTSLKQVIADSYNNAKRLLKPVISQTFDGLLADPDCLISADIMRANRTLALKLTYQVMKVALKRLWGVAATRRDDFVLFHWHYDTDDDSYILEFATMPDPENWDGNKVDEDTDDEEDRL